MSYLLAYGYRVEAQVAIPLPEVSYARGYDGALPWRGTGVVLGEGDEAVLEVKGTVEVRLHPELVATACTEMVAPLERPNECHYGPDGVLQRVGPDYYKEGWAAPMFRVAGSRLPLNFPFRGLGEIEMMRQGTWGPYFNRGILAPYHRYTGNQTVTVYVRRKQQPELTLTCSPNPVTRGNEIRCTVSKKSADVPGELRVTGWKFEGRERMDGEVTSLQWSGVAVTGGTVEVRGTIGNQDVSPAKTDIRVKDREWPVMQLTEPPRVVITVDPVNMSPYPPDANGYGRFILVSDEFRAYFGALPVTVISSGPNAGRSFLPDPVQLMRPNVHLHPALFGRSVPGNLGVPGYFPWNLWYDDQNGRGSGSCRERDIATFRALAQAHEGVAMQANSHYGKANEAFRRAKLHEDFERLSVLGDADALRNEATQTWIRFELGVHNRIQRQFDAVDTPLVFAALGCTLDSNRRDR